MYWIAFAFLTVLCVSALLYPLLRRNQSTAPARAEYDNLVYSSQLSEIAQEVDRGVLSQEQADAARTEIHRRMLSAAAGNKRTTHSEGNRRARIAAAAVIALLVPVGSGLLYSALGSPGMPDQPYAERLRHDPNVIIASTARKLAVQLENKPYAGGYQRLAEIYLYLNEYDRSAAAYQRAIDLGDNNADMWSHLGEAIVAANSGTVVPDALSAFTHALGIDAKEPRARYYLGLAAAQAHELKTAIAIWRDLEMDSTADAPWLPLLRQRITAYAKAGGFDPATVPPEPPLLSKP
ncbi:MAG: c-type cytochrome biogenesis protein CcmI [Alphaproteobacteria bacterium]|nr:c-type cytochrome biogenesis protein CcmI [Alphaproteobacteria bacterium]